MEVILQRCIAEALSAQLHEDAIFLAERLCAHQGPQDLASIHILASTLLTSGQVSQAYHYLRSKNLPHFWGHCLEHNNKHGRAISGSHRRVRLQQVDEDILEQLWYLFAICCFRLQKYQEAEKALRGPSSISSSDPVLATPSGAAHPAKALPLLNGEVPNGAFGLYCLGNVYRHTDRRESAIECFQSALRLNRFLWGAIEALCQLGAEFDVNAHFDTSKAADIAASFNKALQSTPIHSIFCISVNAMPHLPSASSFVSYIPSTSVHSSQQQAIPSDGSSSAASTPLISSQTQPQQIFKGAAPPRPQPAINHQSKSHALDTTPAALSMMTPSSLLQPSHSSGVILPQAPPSTGEFLMHGASHTPRFPQFNGKTPSSAIGGQQGLFSPIPAQPHFDSSFQLRTPMISSPSSAASTPFTFAAPLPPSSTRTSSHPLNFSSAASPFLFNASASVPSSASAVQPLSFQTPSSALFASSPAPAFSLPSSSNMNMMDMSDSTPVSGAQSASAASDDAESATTPDSQIISSSSIPNTGHTFVAPNNAMLPPRTVRKKKAAPRHPQFTPVISSMSSSSAEFTPTLPSSSSSSNDSSILGSVPSNASGKHLFASGGSIASLPQHHEDSEEDSGEEEQEQGKMARAEQHRLMLQSVSVQAMESLLKLFQIVSDSWRLFCMFKCSEAIERLKLLQGSNPRQYETGWVLTLMARCQQEMGDHKAAESFFAKSRLTDSHRLEGIEYYSTTLWHLRKEVDLCQLSQTAHEMDRHSALTLCVIGNCFSLQREHESALVFFQRAIQVNPSFAYAYTLCGHEYLAKEELDEAVSSYRAALRCDARHYNAWYGLGAVYWKQEKHELAVYHFRRANQINARSPVLYCYLGMSLQALQRTNEALQCFGRALILQPSNAAARFRRAILLASMKSPAPRYQEALAELEKLHAAAPREVQVLLAMGKVLRRLGRRKEALKYLNLALDLDVRENMNVKSVIEKIQVSLDENGEDDQEEQEESDDEW